MSGAYEKTIWTISRGACTCALVKGRPAPWLIRLVRKKLDPAVGSAVPSGSARNFEPGEPHQLCHSQHNRIETQVDLIMIAWSIRGR